MLKTVGNLSTKYGDQTIVNGNLVIATSGYGIDFSATPSVSGATSELLDDYEIGTHTATISCGTSGSITLASSGNLLGYCKIGKQITVNGSLDVASVSSPIGYFDISLPVASASLPEGAESSVASIFVTGTNVANLNQFVANVISASASLRVRLGDATTLQSDSAQEIKAASNISFSVTYRTE